MTDLPHRVGVVIVGGGVVGASIAYHLGARAESDVLLLERRSLTCGTTWHAAGLVGQLRATENLTRLAQYTTGLFAGLGAETGQETGFRQIGSVSVATNQERFTELRRNASTARSFGIPCEVIDRDRVAELFPLAHVDDIVGGLHLPDDGITNPVDTTRALAAGARAAGVRIQEGVEVHRILVEGGRAVGVGCLLDGEEVQVRADAVVVAAGMWSRELVHDLGVVLPLHAAEHFYVVTEPLPQVGADLPVLRAADSCCYVKPEGEKLLVGWFEPVAKPWGMPRVGRVSGIPADFAFDSLPPDLDHIAPLMELAAQRVPVLADCGIQLFFNGPESFTPDDRYHLGESAEVDGLYLACGFNSIGVQSSGGAGKVLADWIVDGHPPMDLWDVDVRRAASFQSNLSYLRERTTESLGLLYAMHWPQRQPVTARGVRRSPLHDRLLARGACFGELAGWERPNWYAREGQIAEYSYTFGRPNWFASSAEEHRAVRESVGFFDLSSFSKFRVEGPDAERALSWICSNDVSVPVGTVVYTTWLNSRGTVEADATVTREAEDSYLVVTAAATQTRDLRWLRRQLPPDSRCTVSDVTSSMAVLAVMGPGARTLLAALTVDDLTTEAFPFATSRLIDVGYARARATRISYAGELGWEIYLPTEYALGVFDAIADEGSRHGLVYAGYHALNSLRMEKGFRHWGDDVTTDDTPLDAGLGFTVAWDKPGGFLGRDSLARVRERGLRRRLVHLRAPECTQLLHGGEPVRRDGQVVGRVTSAAYGHTVDAPLGLGYLIREDGPVDTDFLGSGRFEVEVAGEIVPAVVSLRACYDPSGARLRS